MEKVLCVGEILIDFFCSDIDVDLVEGKTFIKQPGGAPANVSAAIAKLGGQAQFCGKVGGDSFGTYLKQTLEEIGVDTSMLIEDPNAPTTLAFVSRQRGGERDFIFHRGADERLTLQEIDEEQIKNIKIAHFGSATALLSDPFYSTYMELMRKLKKNGCFISFDPNYRQDLWKGRETEFIEKVNSCVALADFIKVSEEENELLQIKRTGDTMLAVTMGDKGTFIAHREREGGVPSITVYSIDSTGAGDAFVGAMLAQFAQCASLHNLPFKTLKQFTKFSNIVGALTCVRVGAITSLPTKKDVLSYM
ncbi:carbohydrate kinase family protein [Lysinibacillus sp. 54212]|uniref:carbohydrate kinase family protein n=1 Tax=Lysinibacillus sp. 54212 TaxID=3119829 RepID=UPI002FCB0CE3